MSEQRYLAVLAVIRDGETVTSVATRFEVSRQTMHAWLKKYEAGGLEGLADVSHRPNADGMWVARRASAVGVVCVNWQQVSVGIAAAGQNIDVWVTDEVLQFFDGETLLKTEKGTTDGEPRKKKVSIQGGNRRA